MPESPMLPRHEPGNAKAPTPEEPVPKNTMEAIVGDLRCAECFAKLDYVLEPEKSRFNPRRVKCITPGCKNAGKVFRSRTHLLIEE